MTTHQTVPRTQVLTAGEDGWDAARRAFNLTAAQRPDAVALPESERAVLEAVRFASAAGLRVAPQSTGHNAGPLAPSLDGALLLKTSRLRDVEIDPDPAPRARGRRRALGRGRDRRLSPRPGRAARLVSHGRRGRLLARRRDRLAGSSLRAADEQPHGGRAGHRGRRARARRRGSRARLVLGPPRGRRQLRRRHRARVRALPRPARLRRLARLGLARGRAGAEALETVGGRGAGLGHDVGAHPAAAAGPRPAGRGTRLPARRDRRRCDRRLPTRPRR